jgi:hypothetical protein
VALVDLASVKKHLNIPATDTRQDDELQVFMAAVEDQARDVCGPISAEMHTEYHDGGRAVISLDWQPVLSVTSVTEYIAASTWNLTEQALGSGGMDAYGYTVDLPLGTVTRRSVGSAVPFPRGRENVRIVYTSGLATAPATVFLGALEFIRHMWSMTQQAGRPAYGQAGMGLDTDGAAVPTGFALPARVLELWKPAKRPPGIA